MNGISNKSNKACPYGLWQGERAFVIATGPSLTEADAGKLRNEKVITVNCSIRYAPWSDCHYAGDHKWYAAYKDDWKNYLGLKFSINDQAVKEFDLIKLDTEGRDGIGKKGVCTGGNSGYQAVNLAYLLGAREIYLLGFDMRPKNGVNHFHGDHDRRSPHRLTNPNVSLYRQWIKSFDKLFKALDAEGVKLINCSRETALDIPRMRLEDVIGSSLYPRFA